MSSRKWYIRRSDGKVLDFADLGALRGAIDAGLVDITDDVSRNGEEWSTLLLLLSFKVSFTTVVTPPKSQLLRRFPRLRNHSTNLISMPVSTISPARWRRSAANVLPSLRTAMRCEPRLLSLLALAFGAIVAWGIQTMMDNQERDAAAAGAS